MNLLRWLSLVTVMLGVSVVGLSGSLAKDTGKGDSLTSIAVRMVLREEPPAEVTVFIGELQSFSPPPRATSEHVWLAGILFILFAQLSTLR